MTERADFPAVVGQLFQESALLHPCAAHPDRSVLDMQHGTDDLSAAYRQIPVAHEAYCVCAQWSPEDKAPRYFCFHGHQFGFTTAPQNFNRLPEFLVHASRVIFACAVGHYFDDYDTVEPQYCGQSGQHALAALHGMLQFTIAQEKHESAKPSNVFLGVSTDFSSLRLDGTIHMRAKPGRSEKMCTLLRDILISNSLPPALAASVRGKLQFLTSYSFGRVGRAALQTFCERQYDKSAPSDLTPALREAIHFFLVLLPVHVRRAQAPPHCVPRLAHVNTS